MVNRYDDRNPGSRHDNPYSGWAPGSSGGDPWFDDVRPVSPTVVQAPIPERGWASRIVGNRRLVAVGTAVVMVAGGAVTAVATDTMPGISIGHADAQPTDVPQSAAPVQDPLQQPGPGGRWPYAELAGARALIVEANQADDCATTVTVDEVAATYSQIFLNPELGHLKTAGINDLHALYRKELAELQTAKEAGDLPDFPREEYERLSRPLTLAEGRNSAEYQKIFNDMIAAAKKPGFSDVKDGAKWNARLNAIEIASLPPFKDYQKALAQFAGQLGVNALFKWPVATDSFAAVTAGTPDPEMVVPAKSPDTAANRQTVLDLMVRLSAMPKQMLAKDLGVRQFVFGDFVSQDQASAMVRPGGAPADTNVYVNLDGMGVARLATADHETLGHLGDDKACNDGMGRPTIDGALAALNHGIPYGEATEGQLSNGPITANDGTKVTTMETIAARGGNDTESDGVEVVAAYPYAFSPGTGEIVSGIEEQSTAVEYTALNNAIKLFTGTVGERTPLGVKLAYQLTRMKRLGGNVLAKEGLTEHTLAVATVLGEVATRKAIISLRLNNQGLAPAEKERLTTQEQALEQEFPDTDTVKLLEGAQ